MTPASGARRTRLADLGLLLASTLVGLLLLEGAFRLLDIRGWHEPRTRQWQSALVPEDQLPPGVSARFKPHARFRLDYDSNPRGYFDSRNGLEYETNRWGFRGPDWTREKPARTRRVIVLGDSFAFGEGVRPEDTFCRRLEQRLTEATGSPVEVLNMSTGGWGTGDEIRHLRREGLAFDPDLVVVAYVLNDADYAGRLDLWEGFRRTYEKRWLRSSYVTSWAWSMVARRTMSRAYVDGLVKNALARTESWQESFRLLSRGRELTEARGARFLVCILPFMFSLDDDYPFAPVHAQVSGYCITHGIEVLDLFPAFKGQVDRDLWVHPSDQHPNEKGHAIAAAAMADFILSRRLLPSRDHDRRP